MRSLLDRPRFRLALATWLSLYPLLTAVLWVLQEPLAELPLPVRTLLLTAGLVPVMVYGLVPRVLGWLDAHVPARSDTSAAQG
jgi:antibiotic biosynthesis monooxygenase (ABM) superfamily enzyme